MPDTMTTHLDPQPQTREQAIKLFAAKNMDVIRRFYDGDNYILFAAGWGPELDCLTITREEAHAIITESTTP